MVLTSRPLKRANSAGSGLKGSDETYHVRRRCLGLFQRQEMGCPGHVDQRRPIAQLLLEQNTVFRRRDLIVAPCRSDTWSVPEVPTKP